MASRFEQFSFVISAIYRHIQMIERNEMEKLGLKGVFVQYLELLHRHPEGITSSQICEICVLDKAAVSRTIREMEEHDLICRQGSSYRAKIRLTEQGRQVTEHVLTRTAKAVELAGLPIDDRPALYTSLEHISGILQKLSKEGLPET